MDPMSPNLTNTSLLPNRTDRPELTPADVTMQLVFGSMMLVFGLIGVVGNAVALYAFCRSRSLRRPKNYLIANLCLTDMVICLVYCPIIVTRSLSHGLPNNESCIVEGFVVGLGSIVSICSLAGIAWKRYLTIPNPIKSLSILTHRALLGAVSAVWEYAFLLVFPPLVGWGRFVSEESKISCTFDYMSTDDATRAHVIFLVIGAFGLPFAVIAYCYIRSFAAVRKCTKERKQMSLWAKSDSRSEVKAAVNAFVITTSFCLCWCPYAVVATMGVSGFTVHSHAVFIAALLAKLCVLFNPVAYVLSIPSFRKALFSSSNDRTKYQTAFTFEGLVKSPLMARKREFKSLDGYRSSIVNSNIESIELAVPYSASRESCLLSRAATERLAGRSPSLTDIVGEFGLHHRETWV
ncbi:LOW QUALITY PROTEIN: melanopsin-like [Branchiostoma floridae]|uniref:LOW QUALITY PROTEIN: melanopsin-like n=1 Tax=Branchiostoma floridae TaxID=7739 RepID=A0A9J7HLD6_BRAFL|nr:LOW QUALITY PROTEIN: melanopsin-like [Branchiostoma floridae]